MDFVMGLVIAIAIGVFLTVCICFWKISQKVCGWSSLTRHTGASQVAVPVNSQYLTSQSVNPPPPGFVTQPGNQTTPYPTSQPPGMPCPPQPVTPYPPAQSASEQLPPSYHEAVGLLEPPPSQDPNVTKEVYAKQAPYNPNY